jgi:Rod binding domain-containing protein
MQAVGHLLREVKSTAVPPARLVQAAHEFEAQLMKELLRPMTRSSNEDGDGSGTGSDGSMGALGDFASEALGQALSKQGGLGIATHILSSLSHQEKELGSTSNSGKLLASLDFGAQVNR